MNSHFIEYNRVDIYDPGTDTWDTSRVSNIINRPYITACVIDDRVYVLGGNSWTDDNEVYFFHDVNVYDPETDTWQSRANFPGLSLGSACVLNGKIYIAGGLDGARDPIATAYSYDPVMDQWSRLADSEVPKFSNALLPLNGKIYSIGGIINNIYKESGKGTNSVEIYDPELNKWESGPPLPVPRCEVHGGFVYKGEIYIMGGRENIFPEIAEEEIYKYNPESKQWIEFGELPEGRSQYALSLVNNKAYLMGGFYTNYGNAHANTWELDLTSTGIHDHGSRKFLIYPNPVKESLTIEAPYPHNYHMSISALNGVMIFDYTFSGSQYRVNMSDIPEGIYLVRIWSEQDVWVEKIVKM